MITDYKNNLLEYESKMLSFFKVNKSRFYLKR